MEMLWSFFFAIFIGIISHFYGQSLPRKWFHADKFPYKSFRWEQEGRIYRHIGVHKWQDKLPDLSRVAHNMVPKRMKDGMTVEDVRTLIAEECVAEHVHTVLCIVFLYVAKFWESGTWFFLWCIYTVGNLPFIIIQRYNRPKLVRILKRLEMRNNKEKRAEEVYS